MRAIPLRPDVLRVPTSISLIGIPTAPLLRSRACAAAPIRGNQHVVPPSIRYSCRCFGRRGEMPDFYRLTSPRVSIGRSRGLRRSNQARGDSIPRNSFVFPRRLVLIRLSFSRFSAKSCARDAAKIVLHPRICFRNSSGTKTRLPSAGFCETFLKPGQQSVDSRRDWP